MKLLVALAFLAVIFCLSVSADAAKTKKVKLITTAKVKTGKVKPRKVQTATALTTGYPYYTTGYPYGYPYSTTGYPYTDPYTGYPYGYPYPTTGTVQTGTVKVKTGKVKTGKVKTGTAVTGTAYPYGYPYGYTYGYPYTYPTATTGAPLTTGATFTTGTTITGNPFGGFGGSLSLTINACNFGANNGQRGSYTVSWFGIPAGSASLRVYRNGNVAYTTSISSSQGSLNLATAQAGNTYATISQGGAVISTSNTAYQPQC